jgi:hypothetical protein
MATRAGSSESDKHSKCYGRPAFEVRVERPIFNGARPPWELPGVILGLSERGPKFDQTSSGAKVINVGKGSP